MRQRSTHIYCLVTMPIVTSCSPDKLFTVKDVCASWQCTDRFVEKQVKLGRLKALKISRKMIRFRQADLDAFLKKGATTGQEGE